mgnify:CR=1 FL=1
MLGKPKDEKEKQLFDAIGTIRAARFVRKYAKTRKPIDVGVVYVIHEKIYKDWWQEMAGKLRQEEVKIWRSKHLPPHHSKIGEYMQYLNRDLKDGLEQIDPKKLLSKDKKIYLDEFVRLIKVAAIIHHKIVWIHPFVDGNGRTARLMTNLILERYGLWGLSAQIERENKEAYFNALSQIDDYGDCEPLMDMIAQGLLEKANKLSGSILPFNRS